MCYGCVFSHGTFPRPIILGMLKRTRKSGIYVRRNGVFCDHVRPCALSQRRRRLRRWFAYPPLETSQNRNWLLTKAMVSELPLLRSPRRETLDPCYVSCIRLSASCFITGRCRDSGASATTIASHAIIVIASLKPAGEAEMQLQQRQLFGVSKRDVHEYS